MPETLPVKVSVREITDFICRTGSLDTRTGIARMVEGTRMHNILQSRGGEGYVKEVNLSQTIDVGGLTFELSGRADGIIDEDDGYTVDEIKTTTLPLRFINEEDYPAYSAQVECYAYMFAIKNRLDFIRTRLTFCNIENEDFIYFYHDHTLSELKARVEGLLGEYKKWTLLRMKFDSELHSSAQQLKFPFGDYREGQSEMVLSAYRAFKRRERFYVQAPTGIGKTISAVYPAYRALGDGIGRRIFYLTAKTTVRTAAQNAVDLLRSRGLHTRSIVLTAKEKVCLCRDAVRDCSNLACEYSDGHFSKVNDALFELLSNYESFSAALIEKYAKEFKVCPYELSLDLALWCDIIICDYNYLFDPRVSIKRFFSDEAANPDENLFLIDEAHNLAERSREMYSAELKFTPFLKLLKQIPESDFYLYQPLRGLCVQFLKLKRRSVCSGQESGGSFFMSNNTFDSFGEACKLFATSSIEWIRVMGDTPLTKTVADLRLEARQYLYTLALVDGQYVNYVEASGDEIRVRLLCLDPSGMVSRRLDKGRSAVLFSATLTPLEYYADILGGDNAAKVMLELDSPFPRENLFIAAMDKVSTRFSDRERTIESTAEILETVVNAKIGNYIAYFPSYRLMREVCSAFRQIDLCTRCLIQKPTMSESERESFVRAFERNDGSRSMLGFAVLGGIFSEGIDLTGDKLIGSIIVGVGLAQLNTESNIIAEYYTETRESGFEYAYVYPGMNKVMQAAGRVIRTETDRGVIILIDDRFATPVYTQLYPAHWRGMRLIGDTQSLEAALNMFWKN